MAAVTIEYKKAGLSPLVTPQNNIGGSDSSGSPGQEEIRPVEPSVRSTVQLPPQSVLPLLGSADENLRLLERLLNADIHVRGNEVTLTGIASDVALAERVLAELLTIARRDQHLTPDVVERSITMLQQGGMSPAEVLSLDIISRRGKTIRPKTLNQKNYVDAIDAATIVFGIGPAGTGKTYLAMAKAVQALQAKQVNRIILTRPAVEAGERLGFLPGTLNEKIDPYLRPLYDALHDMIDPEAIPKLMQAGVIEVAPLAYMRGRAQPVFTKVLTPEGFRPIGELEAGDFVIGSDGQPTQVEGVYPQGFKEIYRVHTQDGSSTLASGDHLWSVHTREDKRRGKPARVLQTKEMIGNLRAAHYHRYELPLLSSPVQFQERPVPMDPYAMGLLLGDGCITCSTTPTFATNDPELADALRSDKKFIPESYLYNSEAIRVAVLQGLLDADGGRVTQNARTCRIQFTTVSDQLRDDVIFLVQSLGGIVYSRTKPAEGRKPGLAKGRAVPYRHDAHVLDIRLPGGITPFRLSRKAEKYTATGGGRPMRYIDRIEPAGTEEAVCIQVAAADSLYVTEDFLLTHNTLNDAFIILDEAQNTTREQMKMFLTRLGFGSKIVVTGDVTQVDLPTGTNSGLLIASEILSEIEGIRLIRLSSGDVVRHRLVSDIVDAYERFEEENQSQDAMRFKNRAQRRSAEHRFPRR